MRMKRIMHLINRVKKKKAQDINGSLLKSYYSKLKPHLKLNHKYTSLLTILALYRFKMVCPLKLATLTTWVNFLRKILTYKMPLNPKMFPLYIKKNHLLNWVILIARLVSKKNHLRRFNEGSCFKFLKIKYMN